MSATLNLNIIGSGQVPLIGVDVEDSLEEVGGLRAKQARKVELTRQDFSVQSLGVRVVEGQGAHHNGVENDAQTPDVGLET